MNWLFWAFQLGQTFFSRWPGGAACSQQFPKKSRTKTLSTRGCSFRGDWAREGDPTRMPHDLSREQFCAKWHYQWKVFVYWIVQYNMICRRSFLLTSHPNIFKKVLSYIQCTTYTVLCLTNSVFYWNFHLVESALPPPPSTALRARVVNMIVGGNPLQKIPS